MPKFYGGRGATAPLTSLNKKEAHKMTTLTARKNSPHPLKLYHVTPAANYASIEAYGVHPRYSKGKRKVSWWVRGDMLMWAIAHVSLRHDTSVAHLLVYQATIDRSLLLATRWPGVYMSALPVTPPDVFRAQKFTDEPEFVISSQGALDHD